MNPSVPNVPNLSDIKNDPRFAGAVDLDKVRADADQAKAEREAQAMAAAQEYVRNWHRAMNRTFKGIVGGSSLHRRFMLRAEGKRMDRGTKPTFKGMGG